MYEVFCFLPFPEDDFDFFFFFLLNPCRLEGSLEVVLRVETFSSARSSSSASTSSRP